MRLRKSRRAATGRSLEVIQAELKAPRIHAVELQENAGACVARNTAIAAASEIPWTHITFIDPDDVATPPIGWSMECRFWGTSVPVGPGRFSNEWMRA